MRVYRKQGYIFMINIICVFLRFTCLLFQLFESHNFCRQPPPKIEWGPIASSAEKKYDICFFMHWRFFFAQFVKCEKLAYTNTHTHIQHRNEFMRKSHRSLENQHHLWTAPNGIYSHFHRDFHLLFKLDQTFNSSCILHSPHLFIRRLRIRSLFENWL